MIDPVTRPVPVFSAFADAAFGPRPDRSAAELPEPSDPLEMWWRAVALGGAGHYAAGRTALRRLSAATTDPVLLSLAASTRGSLLRQLGWHERAAGYDGQAAALVLPAVAAAAARPPHPGSEGTVAPVGYGDRPDAVDAAADALIGLAADALGVGRTALSARLLDRCTALLDRAAPDPGGYTALGTGVTQRPRARVRLHWVRAETALADGRGTPALAEADAALTLAEQGPSARHRVKSRLLFAAAASATGQPDRARALADRIDEECRAAGLVPLRWACAMLRGGLAATSGDRDTATSDAAACRAVISRRGGLFRDVGR
ncbi:hypothetical protein [Nocardia sp. NBC_01329]|uniref:hypothetical protein n=1 Tax=Nocardia sp. NBC_01329 TaxID=2903594 RepID=UPI002E121490|nr:hypothetical protein OG405_00805 [Nocardia sp. NBC_01329]